MPKIICQEITHTIQMKIKHIYSSIKIYSKMQIPLKNLTVITP